MFIKGKHLNIRPHHRKSCNVWTGIVWRTMPWALTCYIYKVHWLRRCKVFSKVYIMSAPQLPGGTKGKDYPQVNPGLCSSSLLKLHKNIYVTEAVSFLKNRCTYAWIGRDALVIHKFQNEATGFVTRFCWRFVARWHGWFFSGSYSLSDFRYAPLLVKSKQLIGWS